MGWRIDVPPSGRQQKARIVAHRDQDAVKAERTTLASFDTGLLWSAVLVAIALAAGGFAIIGYIERRYLAWQWEE